MAGNDFPCGLQLPAYVFDTLIIRYNTDTNLRPIMRPLKALLRAFPIFSVALAVFF